MLAGRQGDRLRCARQMWRMNETGAVSASRRQARDLRPRPSRARSTAIAGRWIVGAGLACALVIGCGHAARRPATEPPSAGAKLQLIAGRGAGGVAAKLTDDRRLAVAPRSAESWLTAVAERGDEDPALAAVARARRLLKEAREAYRKLEMGRAIGLLATATTPLVAIARSAAHFALLAKISLQRALAQLALEDRAGAAASVREALALGYRGPRPGEQPPQVRSFIASLRSEQNRAPAVALRISSTPAGAEVVVDGKPVGRTPVTVQLAPATHHVRIAALGFRPQASLQPLSARDTALSATLKRAGRSALAGQLLRAHQAGEDLTKHRQLLAVLQPAGSAYLAVTHHGTQLASRLIVRREADSTAEAVRCTAPDEAALARCLAGQLRSHAGVLRGSGRPKRRAVAQESPPVYRRWWFWALVGGAVAASAGASVGAYYATRPAGIDVDIVSK